MRIHICGIYGSGKSVLAKILSKEFGIKSYALDDIKYKVKYNQIRSVEERIKKLKKICSLPEWITEGTWSNYAEDAFQKADVIISGVGKPGLINANMVSDGAIIIDAGTAMDTGALRGDADYESLKSKEGWLSPVPGGVGPLTVAHVFKNLATLAS